MVENSSPWRSGVASYRRRQSPAPPVFSPLSVAAIRARSLGGTAARRIAGRCTEIPLPGGCIRPGAVIHCDTWGGSAVGGARLDRKRPFGPTKQRRALPVKYLKHPATIIATVALFIALGGGAAAYASGLINGSQIKNHSIPAKKLTRSAIQSLHGQRGPTGPPGPKGNPGPKGDTGPQ